MIHLESVTGPAGGKAGQLVAADRLTLEVRVAMAFDCAVYRPAKRDD